MGPLNVSLSSAFRPTPQPLVPIQSSESIHFLCLIHIELFRVIIYNTSKEPAGPRVEFGDTIGEIRMLSMVMDN